MKTVRIAIEVEGEHTQVLEFRMSDPMIPGRCINPIDIARRANDEVKVSVDMKRSVFEGFDREQRLVETIDPRVEVRIEGELDANRVLNYGINERVIKR